MKQKKVNQMNSSYISVFKHLLITDLTIFRQVIVDKVVNSIIWAGSTLVVMEYLLPGLRGGIGYGSFMVAGSCASIGLFEVFPSVMELVTDFEGERIIDYYLTLPIPSWMVLVRNALYYAFGAFCLGISILPLGKMLLWYRFDLSQLSVVKYMLIFIATSAFYGSFTLLVASLVKNMMTIGNVWMRFLFPMWFLGGFQFAWSALKSFSVPLAYVALLNPMTYIMDGMRAAVLGQENYLNFWLCLATVICFTVCFSYIAICRLKKRLDFV